MVRAFVDLAKYILGRDRLQKTPSLLFLVGAYQ
jgi:hypothetical protein